MSYSGEPRLVSQDTFSGLRQWEHCVLSERESRGVFRAPFKDFLPLITFKCRATPW